MDWSQVPNTLAWFVVAIIVGGAIAIAHRCAHAAQDTATDAQMQLAFLRDRLGISDAEVDEWHREHHPDCYDGEPAAAVAGPPRPGDSCPICTEGDVTGSEYRPPFQELRVQHGDGSRCSEAPVTPAGARIDGSGWPFARRTQREQDGR